MAELPVPSDEATELAGYSAVSPAAVGSLVLGLLSPLALVGMLLLFIPAVGIALAVIALRAIRLSNGDLAGRGAALTGLALCTIFATASPVKSAYTSYCLANASRPIVDAWFDFLRNGEPQKALQLTMPAVHRHELDESLWSYYSDSKENRENLEGFVASAVPRLVLEYGEKCQARFYDVIRVTPGAASDTIEMVYALTYPDGEGKKSILVAMTVERRPLEGGKIGWRILSNKGGYRPEG